MKVTHAPQLPPYVLHPQGRQLVVENARLKVKHAKAPPPLHLRGGPRTVVTHASHLRE